MKCEMRPAEMRAKPLVPLSHEGPRLLLVLQHFCFTPSFKNKKKKRKEWEVLEGSGKEVDVKCEV